MLNDSTREQLNALCRNKSPRYWRDLNNVLRLGLTIMERMLESYNQDKEKALTLVKDGHGFVLCVWRDELIGKTQMTIKESTWSLHGTVIVLGRYIPQYDTLVDPLKDRDIKIEGRTAIDCGLGWRQVLIADIVDIGLISAWPLKPEA